MEFDNVLPSGKFAFSIGHFLNDLCASVWFSYALVFYHRVAKFSNSSAGYLLFIGQVADALSTTFVGFASDRTKGHFYGRRKSWYLLGVVCVLLSFPFCFQSPQFQSTEYSSSFLYYTVFIVVFQFGWACSQIGHLSMLNELTSKEGERVALNAYRHAWSIVANIFVYAVTWFILDQNQINNDAQMDANIFRTLTHVIIITGLITSLIFYFGSTEPASVTKYHQNLQVPCRTWREFLCDSQFYLISVIWMLTRVISNISQVYLPLFIMDSIDTSQVDRRLIAIGPLVVYISGFLTSFPMRAVNQFLGRRPTMVLGLSAVLFSSSLFWNVFSLHQSMNISIQCIIILGAISLGIGITTAQITSGAFTSDLIGQNTGSGAFVYGAMSFLDKLANGMVIAIIQQYNPCSTCSTCCSLFYRKILSFVPGVITISTLLILTGLSHLYTNSRQIRSTQPNIFFRCHRTVQRNIKMMLTKVL